MVLVLFLGVNICVNPSAIGQYSDNNNASSFPRCISSSLLPTFCFSLQSTIKYCIGTEASTSDLNLLQDGHQLFFTNLKRSHVLGIFGQQLAHSFAQSGRACLPRVSRVPRVRGARDDYGGLYFIPAYYSILPFYTTNIPYCPTAAEHSFFSLFIPQLLF